MITLEMVIILTMQVYLGEKTMSVIVSIFQAIFEAFTEILPLSSSGYTAIFNTFSGRNFDRATQLTGVIHIGIAIGILIVMFKMFANEAVSFFEFNIDLFDRNKSIKNAGGIKKFTMMTFVSFVPFLLLLIPIKGKNIYYYLHLSSYDGNLISEGICFLVLAGLLFCANKQLSLRKNRNQIGVLFAIVLGFAAMLSSCVAGLSVIGLVFCICVLFGITKNISYRYSFALAMPIFLVRGILEVVFANIQTDFILALIAAILSATVTYFATKLFLWIINCNKIKYLYRYNLGIGVLALIIGLIELIAK